MFYHKPKRLFSPKFSLNLAAFAKVDIWRIFPDLGVQWAAKPVSGSWHAGGGILAKVRRNAKARCAHPSAAWKVGHSSGGTAPACMQNIQAWQISLLLISAAINGILFVKTHPLLKNEKSQ